ncbi:MAG: hypothetical protein RMM98_01190 [Acidobacteriota bacterium]|nr:hypothetical protein [Blastocatellia bacterium]MDW8238201.1 hypothetical protein [Acidobacteriota bacterium]
MSKFLATTTVFVAAVSMSTAGLAQSKLVPQEPIPVKTRVATTKTQSATEVKSASQMVAGWLTSIDVKTKTLTVAEGTKSLTFVWDADTKITGRGHAVKPSALLPGARLTVYYQMKNGRNWANSIVINSVPRKAKK